MQFGLKLGNVCAWFQNVGCDNLNQHVQFHARVRVIHEKYPLALWQKPITTAETKW